jgi:hypothetical protein
LCFKNSKVSEANLQKDPTEFQSEENSSFLDNIQSAILVAALS